MSVILNTMTEKEQRALFTELAFKFSQGNEALSADEQDLWDALHDSCKTLRGRISFAEFVKLPGIGGRKGFRTTADAVINLVNRSCNVIVRRPLKMQILRLGLRYLAEDLEDAGEKVSPLTLMRNIDDLPGCLDRRFPGYMESRLLHRVAGVL